MSQSHFTLRFPLKAQAGTQALTDELTSLMPVLFQAAETIGTVHYARFTVLSERTLLFLGDFDGEFTLLMSALANLRDRCSTRFSAMSMAHHPRRSPTTRMPSLNGRRSIWCIR